MDLGTTSSGSNAHFAYNLCTTPVRIKRVNTSKVLRKTPATQFVLKKKFNDPMFLSQGAEHNCVLVPGKHSCFPISGMEQTLKYVTLPQYSKMSLKCCFLLSDEAQGETTCLSFWIEYPNGPQIFSYSIHPIISLKWKAPVFHGIVSLLCSLQGKLHRVPCVLVALSFPEPLV